MLWTKRSGTAAISPNIVVTSACEIPPAISLGSPVPNNVIDWNVSIIPTTVPSNPRRGATAANNFMVLRFCSRTGTALERTSSSCASRSSGEVP